MIKCFSCWCNRCCCCVLYWINTDCYVGWQYLIFKLTIAQYIMFFQKVMVSNQTSKPSQQSPLQLVLRKSVTLVVDYVPWLKAWFRQIMFSTRNFNWSFIDIRYLQLLVSWLSWGLTLFWLFSYFFLRFWFWYFNYYLRLKVSKGISLTLTVGNQAD